MIEKISNEKIKNFIEVYKKYLDFEEIGIVLNYESEVFMPEDSAERRGYLIGFLETEAHKIIVSPEFEEKLIECEKEESLNETERAIVRISRKILNTEKKLPEDFVRRRSEQFSKAGIVWRNAKANNNFKEFENDLQKNLDLTLEYIELKGYEKHPYDALLDDYEIGLDTETVRNIFAKLIPATKEILGNLKKQEIKSELIDGSKFVYPRESQLKIAKLISRKLGLGKKSSRLDESSHPFSQDFNLNDVRITTRINEKDPFFSITSTIHEVGHALYMCGYSKDLAGTPVGNTNFVLGLHESQSRSWENFVGRSMEFCEWLYPILESHYPWLSDYSAKDIFNILNYVHPSLIRTEADQVTYNLHIALRFEIELRLIEKTLKVSDLPNFWREKMKEYFGIYSEKDSEGVLQDIHWSLGSIGYFPTYTFGNVYAAQIFNTFLKYDPKFFEKVKAGDFTSYLNWLRENMHQYGIIYSPKELMVKMTGEESNVNYLIEYLKKNYSE